MNPPKFHCQTSDFRRVGQLQAPISPWSWVALDCKSGAAMSLQLRSVPGLLTDGRLIGKNDVEFNRQCPCLSAF